MPSPVIYETNYTGGFIVSKHPESMDAGYLDNSSGSDVLFSGGLVVVQAAAGAVTSAAKAGGNTGNGTVGSLSVGALSEEGAYTVTFISATAFTVSAPSGDQIGTGVVGTAFAGQVNFTITAGGTAFVVGDGFVLTVTEQSSAWVSWTGGTITTPIGILYDKVWVEAGNFAKVAILRRNAEVNAGELQWDPAVTGSGSYATLVQTALAALALAFVVAR